MQALKIGPAAYMNYEDQHKIPEYLPNSDYVFAGSAWLLTSLFAAAAHAYYSYD